MKIYKTNTYLDIPMEELTTEQAVRRVLTPDPYSYSGSLERIEEEVALMAKFIVRLTEQLIEGVPLSAKEVENILGPGYSVEEDPDD